MMDLSNFKLINDTDSTYEIAHPNGKMLSINKDKLSDKAHAVIMKLKGPQNLDSGGMPDSPALGQAVSQAIDTTPRYDLPIQQVPNSPLMPPGYVDPQAQGQTVNQPIDQTAQPANQGSIEGGAMAVPSQGQASNDAFNQMQAARQKESDIYGQAAAVTGHGNLSNNDLQQLLPNTQEVKQQEANYQTHMQTLQQQNDELYKQIGTGKLDPNHLWNSSSTGAKISAAIGLVLGGIGSGLTHGPNMALQVLDNSIQRDLQAQMSDQSKGMNLYRMNQEAIGNDRQAYLAAQGQLLTAAKVQIDRAATTAQTLAAKTNLQVMQQHINGEIAQSNFQRSLMMDHSTDPGAKIQYLVPQQEQPAAFDAVDKAKTIGANMSHWLDLWDKGASDLNTAGGITKSLFRENPNIASLNLQMQPIMKDEMGRPNPIAAAAVMENMPKRFNTEEERNTAKQGFVDFLNHTMYQKSTMLKNYGIDLPQYTQQLQRRQGKPGAIYTVKGQPGNYQLGTDANTLQPLGQ